MSTTVLLTTVGGKTHPSIVKSLKSVEERELRVVGTDPVSTLPCEFMVDEFYETATVLEDTEGFLSDIEHIIETEDVDLIIPCVNEEALALANHRERIEDSSVQLLSADYESLEAAFDKYKTYEILSEQTPEAAPDYHLATSDEEFEAAVSDLGFPEQKIVVKPRHGRGGRGVLILDPEMNISDVLSSKPGRRYPYGFVEQLISEHDWSEDLLVMEYLPGEIYSTYALCEDGETLATLTHKRLWGTASQTLKSRIVDREDINATVEAVNAEFGFDYNINYEFKLDGDGNAVMYDLNPRMAASTAVFRGVGVNLPYLSVKLALGDAVAPNPDTDDIMMMRYFQELFLNESTGEIFEL